MEIDKIICGDAYELIKNIPDKSIDCIITDPPYEYDEKTKWFQRGLSEKKKKSFNGISKDENSNTSLNESTYRVIFNKTLEAVGKLLLIVFPYP